MHKENILLIGNIINPLSYKKCSFIPEGYILFSKKTGKISDTGYYFQLKDQDLEKFEIINVCPDYIIPAFTDMHTHIPQYPIRGTGEKSLLYWLDSYVRDAEIRFCCEDHARRVTSDFFDALIKAGTATICAYSNGSIESTDTVFEIALKKGIRLICGNVLGDLGGFYCREFEPGRILRETVLLIEKWHSYNNRLFYALTPRFALFCSVPFMKELSALYDRHESLYLQTHLSENKDEISQVMKLHRHYKDYTDIYDSCGLLKKNTLLAHGIYLNDRERCTIKKRSSSIIHCPASNRFLKSGIMPLKNYLEEGISVGLGTDIGGGYNISMLDELREAIEQSKTLSLIEDRDLSVSCTQGIYTACTGSASALNIPDASGTIEKGSYADLAVIKNRNGMKNDIELILSDIIYNSHEISMLFCMGKLLHQSLSRTGDCL